MTDEEIKEYWRTAYCNEKHKKEELEKENAELKLKLEALEGQTPWKDVKDKSELIKENKELKDELKKWKDGIALKDEEIGCIETDFNTFKSKAKEIIREFVEWATWQGSNCPNFKSIQDKAEQFLKENE